MGAAMTHRGPDGSGKYIGGSNGVSIGLAHRRLAIRDLSDAGKQPIGMPAAEIMLVFNGEIYNDGPLESEIHAATGFNRRGHCDAEILPAAFALWGLEMFDRLRGMFAIAVWDGVREQLTLARDHLGIKPLFYGDDGTTIRFASEIKGLLADPNQQRALDHEQLHAYLAQGYPDPDRSLIASIRQVAPGEAIVIDRSGATRRRWFVPHRRGSVRRAGDAIEGFLALWPEVLKDHRRSDVPLVVLQSGGIDSSLITAGMSASSPPRLVTARFESRDHDESDLAAMVGSCFGCEQRTITIDEDRQAEDLFRTVARHVDGQLADSSAYAFLQVVQAARRYCTVALTGDGGDELFAGYPTVFATRLARLGRWFAPRALTRPVGGFCQKRAARYQGRLSAWDALARFALGLGQPSPHSQWRRLLMAGEAAALYGTDIRPVLNENPLDAYDSAFYSAAGSWADKALIADQAHYLPGDLLAKSDLMSMAVGLEVRVPFLDRRVVEFAAGLDMGLLQPFGRQGKKLLRAAGSALGVPDRLLRERKRGFNVPAAQLLRGRLLPLTRRYLVDQADALERLFRPQRLRLIVEEHARGERDHGYVLWALLIFSLWYQDHLSVTSRGAGRTHVDSTHTIPAVGK
jgi:asparagine synthase (glutamine-hydrolysing)